MLDWGVISDHIEHGQTLSVEDLVVEISRIHENEPNVASELTRYFTRTGRLGNFMQTSISNADQQSQRLENGTLIDHWRIVDFVGAGGMGNVYRAERSDGLYEQTAALKIINSDDPASCARFDKERQRLASLEHPGISRIIDGGTTDNGQPYMVMEYVDGEDIDIYSRSKGLDRLQILELFSSLCGAVAHAHSKLILHHDIKSSNVLVDATGDVRLIDFGIASVINEESDRFDGPMTIAYAPPEQLMRGHPSVGSDIFALGTLLYHLLTGKLPKRNSDGSVSVDSEKINDSDIFAIVSKATAFKIEDRYQSVTAFSDDINAFQHIRPVSARSGDSLYTARKFVRRNALACVLGGALIMALTGGLITSLSFANKAGAEAVRANEALDEAEWNLVRASDHSDLSSIRADAFQYVIGNDDERLGARLLEYLEAIPEEELINNPNRYSTKVFIIGKHFLEKNDYIKAKEILEPWVKADVGRPRILAFGKVTLAFAYQKLGQKQEALNLYREVYQYYIGTPENETIEHAAAAIQVGLLSSDDTETRNSIKIVEKVLEKDGGLYNRLYLIGKMHELELRLGNKDRAYEALQKSIRLIEDGHLGQIAGKDTRYVNFARASLFMKNDQVTARNYLEKALAITESYKGESQTLGLIYELQALLSWLDNDPATAIQYGGKALVLLEKYTGKSPEYAAVKGQLGIFYAEKGDLELANKTLLELQAIDLDGAAIWQDLLGLHLIAKEEGFEAAKTHFANSKIDRAAMEKSLAVSFYLNQLWQRD